MKLLFFLLQIRLQNRDGGPVYTETDISRLIVEPWNTVSAAVFLGIVIYWLYKLKGNFKGHLFLSIALPILAIGGVGGTLYHAFRVSRIFLMMDWLPIMILCLAASVYFFIRALGSWVPAALILVGAFALQSLLFATRWVPIQVAVNLNYIMLALLVLVPTSLFLYKTQFRYGRWVLYALGAFIAAIIFRMADPAAWIPMGTHFLWHVFGAVACHCMIHYIYVVGRLSQEVPQKQSLV